MINGEGWVLTSANGINDRGEIVGAGLGETDPKFHEWYERAFLLEPVDSDVTP